MNESTRFYSDLAHWWPLVSPVDDYTEEAAEMIRVLREPRRMFIATRR